MALSFQTSDGCQEVWDEIRIVQGRKPDSKEIIASKIKIIQQKQKKKTQVLKKVTFFISFNAR
jgi:hypothetical protein